MWKKENTTSAKEEMHETAEFRSSFKPDPVSAPTSRADTASIGHTISIDGKISGEENLIIQGKIKGEIKLSKHTLSIGRNGNVNASVLAKIVKVDGEVKGDIEGSERVIINESGRVYGNIKSPRVVLKDGSRFKGNIDMQQNDDTNKPANTNKENSLQQKITNQKPTEKSNANPLNNANISKNANSSSSLNSSNHSSNNTNKLNPNKADASSDKKKIDLRNL